MSQLHSHRATMSHPDSSDDQPPSVLWATRENGLRVDCLVRLFVATIEVEVRVNRVQLVRASFVTSEEALAFSNQQRRVWIHRE